MMITHKHSAAMFPLKGKAGQSLGHGVVVQSNDGKRRVITSPYGIRVDIIEGMA